jgi:hypothetical protein
MEAIIACGFESKALILGEYSFTNTLIYILDDWINRRSFSASCLHAKILSQLKLKETKKGRGGAKLEWCITPIHINYTQDSKVLSIELCRRNVLPPPSTSATEPEANPPVDTMDLDFDDPCFPPLSSIPSVTPSVRFPHVLISLALEESQPDLDVKKTARWLESIPLLAKWAKVEGVYQSYSTLLILSVPVPVWNMLPDNPACLSTGYATSPNLVIPARPFTKLEPIHVSTEGHTIKQELNEEKEKFFGLSTAASLTSRPLESLATMSSVV